MEVENKFANIARRLYQGPLRFKVFMFRRLSNTEIK
jgi:hypothetical protein